VAVRALRRGGLRPGERAVVVGLGAVGLMAVQAAAAFGAESVAVIEPLPERRALAMRLGADRQVSPDDAATLQADVAVECAGSPAAVETAVRALRTGGRAVVLGIGSQPAQVAPMDLVAGEKSIIGSLSHVWDDDFRIALGLLGRGAVRAAPLITDRIPLGAAVTGGLALLRMSVDDASALPDLVTERLSTAVVSDILDDLGHRDHVLDPAIRPLGDAAVIAGWANPFLIAEVDEIPADPYTGEIAAMDEIAPADVVLIAAGGSARAACWGELFSTAARARGARGTVIDGYCRDAQVIAALGYPVWCRGLLPLDVKGRLAVTAWRQPAVVGSLPVQPGDLVVADADGVVAVPAGLAAETVRRALEKVSKENGVRDALAGGSTLRSAYDRFGVL
jgi:regulator of RNase E activity RraA